MEGDSFAAYAPGGEHVIRAHGGARLAYIVPSPELIEQTSFAHLLGKATIQEKANLEIISTGSDAMTRLQNFLQDLGSLATNTPQAMSNAQVFRHMEQVLMELLVAAYSSRGPEGGNTGRAPHSRRRVLHKIDELLRSKATEPVYVTDLCTVAGISQPTLYRVFYDTFQINPKRYLQLRRLHLARERLQDSSNPAQSVSTIAFDCGFWQLGRFGQAYRELFGETPSQTLRRSRNGAPKIS
ncbi:MAG: helix-turn-helix domain-containing protein [Hyphomicrobiaceae bacterium]